MPERPSSCPLRGKLPASGVRDPKGEQYQNPRTLELLPHSDRKQIEQPVHMAEDPPSRLQFG